MLKKTIKFIDFAGNETEEDFYFNLSKAELAEMEISEDGGLGESLQRIVKNQNGKEIIATFKNIILKSYGERSEDGRRFIKSDEKALEFSQTEAFSELFVELVTNPDASAKFIEGVLPREVVEKAKSAVTETVLSYRAQEVEPPAWIREDREPTNEEFQKMSREELLEAMRRKTERMKSQ